MFLKKFIFIAIVATTVSGCLRSITETNVESHGYVPNIDQIRSMRVEQPSKQQIQAVLGKPFVVGVYDQDYWYYISFRTEQYGFSKKEIKDFKIVEIFFEKDSVSQVTEFDQSTLQDIAYSTAQTETGGKTLGIFEQIVGNIGKVRSRTKK